MRQDVGQLIASLAHELNALGGQALRLQDALAPDETPNVESGTLQSLDLLTQSLQCLAIFTAELAHRLPPHCMVDAGEALDRVNLGALSRRLGGDLRPALDEAATIELF